MVELAQNAAVVRGKLPFLFVRAAPRVRLLNRVADQKFPVYELITRGDAQPNNLELPRTRERRDI